MLQDKYIKLKEILLEMDSIVIAYSGGVDSTFLLKVANEVLGDKAIAITSTSETLSKRELAAAKSYAQTFGVKLKMIYTNELADENFCSNPENRCYYCKKELFSQLIAYAKENGYSAVADGANYDDLQDHRPGMLAGKELGVRSPLQEAQLTKDEIRQLSYQLDLPTWNKPAKACLSSRFPYGDPITLEKIKQVEQGEDFLEDLGFHQYRLRHHHKLARIEVPADQFSLILDDNIRHSIIEKFTSLGFTYVTLDIKGFRSGSMNESLNKQEE